MERYDEDMVCRVHHTDNGGKSDGRGSTPGVLMVNSMVSFFSWLFEDSRTIHGFSSSSPVLYSFLDSLLSFSRIQ
jgi:hypothetical protein